MVKLDQGAVTFEAVQMNREGAEKLLGSNTHNRKVRASRTNIYAVDMLQGQWVTTGDAIKVSKNGGLLDGQHRLAALVQAATTGARIGSGPDGQLPAQPDITIPMVVVRGLDDSAQEAMDTGAARTLADVLELREETSTNNLAANIRIIYAWEKAGARRTIAKRDQATNATLLKFFESDPDMFRLLTRQVLSDYQRMGVDKLLPPSVLALTRYLFESIDTEGDDVAQFFELLVTQQGLKGDPVFELVQALKRTRRERGYHGIAYSLALTIKAWNAYRKGEKITLLSYKAGGATPENFPEPM